MKRTHYIQLLLAALMVVIAATATAEIVTPEQARRIASNWLDLIVYTHGDWAGSSEPAVVDIDDFRRGDRLLGYCCHVEPRGFVVVSAVKGLAPVKAYSGSSSFDVEAEDGLVDVIALKMEAVRHELELQLDSPENATEAEVDRLLGYHFGELTEALTLGDGELKRRLESGKTKANYTEGDSLLTEGWRQSWPYNYFCPVPTNQCPWSHCAVGCVATAGAQIMHYWSWPPGRPWAIMPDSLTDSSTWSQVDAVAQLCADIGTAVSMVYCEDTTCGSAAYTSDMEFVFEGSHYGDCAVAWRKDFYFEYWWGGPGMMKAQLSANRPMEYRILRHAIVIDGWREWYWGSYQRELHANYGWASADNAWYFMDALLQVEDTGTFLHEFAILGTVPNVALESAVSGVIPRNDAWPYRYVDRDCAGTDAAFAEGQRIQFLPGVRLFCRHGTVEFPASRNYPTYLYTPEITRGIKLSGGSLVLHEGAAVRFQQDRSR